MQRIRSVAGRGDTLALLSLMLVLTMVAGCESEQSGMNYGIDYGIDQGADENSAPEILDDSADDTEPDLPREPADVQEEACTAVEVQAQNAIAPVDIIWAVDSSGSMEFENSAVRDNLNRFSMSIWTSGIDHHVILIGSAAEMNVPPPLGGSEFFMHIDDPVGSNHALIKLVEHYPDYQAFLRPGAVRHFVAVTDDESAISADEFMFNVAFFTDPGFPDWFTFHSIVSFGPIPDKGCITGAAIGWQYLTLSDLTGGVKQQVCQTDWSPIFDALETAIAVTTVLPCAYDIPDPPEDETLDPGKVNVYYISSDGTETVIPKVADPGSCGAFGWYYDDPDRPERIMVCPDTCLTLQSDSGGRVNLAFGCNTVVI
jgi:hypothetical protein